MEKFATENLILIEFLVERISFEYNLMKELVMMEGETCVSFQFLDNGPIFICEADFPSSCPVTNIKNGKSCLFSLTPEQADDALKYFDVYVQVFKKLKTGATDKMFIGESLVSVANLFKDLMDSVCAGETNCAKILKDCFTVNSTRGEVVGSINVYIRLSCYGKLIVTQFQMNIDDKSAEFKGKDGRYLFKTKNKELECNSGRSKSVDCNATPLKSAPQYYQKMKISSPSTACCSPLGSSRQSLCRPPTGSLRPRPSTATTSGYCTLQVPSSQNPSRCSYQQIEESDGNRGCLHDDQNIEGNHFTQNYEPMVCCKCSNTLPPCCFPSSYQSTPLSYHQSTPSCYQPTSPSYDSTPPNYQTSSSYQSPSSSPRQSLVMRPGCPNWNSSPFSFQIDGNQGGNNICVNPPTCTASNGTKFTEISDPDKEMFVLRIGKKTEGASRRNNVDLELSTPKPVPQPVPPVLDTKRVQYDFNDLPEEYLEEYYGKDWRDVIKKLNGDDDEGEEGKGGKGGKGGGDAEKRRRRRSAGGGGAGVYIEKIRTESCNPCDPCDPCNLCRIPRSCYACCPR